MADNDLLRLSELQREYADLLGELQKILKRMSGNDGKADEADRQHFKKTERRMKQVQTELEKLKEKLLAR